VLAREGLSDQVKVIGGGRVTDGYVVTQEVKKHLVMHLQETHKIFVYAFGDSPLDLPMLRRANEAIVVVGEESSRSQSMDKVLLDAISNHGLVAHQVVLPASAVPRLDITRLPLVKFTDKAFVEGLLCRRGQEPQEVLKKELLPSKTECITQHKLQLTIAKNTAAVKVLSTPMRDAAVKGPGLRAAHAAVGRYLATEYMAATIGVEEYDMMHVQGGTTKGHRILNEAQTLIVALMRGGEPMALGVNDVFPCAPLLHATRAQHVSSTQLIGMRTVVLVDSVVNTGRTMLKFVHHIQALHPTIRIIMVGGVVQAEAVAEDSTLMALTHGEQISFVALRKSENNYLGTGGTDTGNRLFNTTYLA
jgi:uracil phosphoribosyltransferase